MTQQKGHLTGSRPAAAESPQLILPAPVQVDDMTSGALRRRPVILQAEGGAGAILKSRPGQSKLRTMSPPGSPSRSFSAGGDVSTGWLLPSLEAVAEIRRELIEPRLSDAGLRATKPKRSTAEVVQDEMSLAGYLLARAADGRKVDGESFVRLRSANDTVREVRALLPFGRGNVSQDIALSMGEGTRRVKGHRALGGDKSIESDTASQAIWSGSGFCGEHASLSAVVHASRFVGDLANETVATVSAKNIDHAWTESMPAKPDRSTKSDKNKFEQERIVLDAWCEGPAVFAEDSRYSSSKQAATVLDTFGLDAKNKFSQARQQAQELAVKHDPRTLSYPELSKRFVWNATEGIDEKFSGRVANKLAKPVTLKEATKIASKSTMTRVEDRMSLMNPVNWQKGVKARKTFKKVQQDADVKMPVRAGSAARHLFEHERLLQIDQQLLIATTRLLPMPSFSIERIDLAQGIRELKSEKRELQQLIAGAAPTAIRAVGPSKFEVQQAMDRTGTLGVEARNQILAVSVVRELAPDANIRSAVLQAPSILEAAKQLGHYQPRVSEDAIPADLLRIGEVLTRKHVSILVATSPFVEPLTTAVPERGTPVSSAARGSFSKILARCMQFLKT